MDGRRDYYAVLGVPHDANLAEIKRVYRELARQHHPDHNPDLPGAEERLKEINEAYDVLGDPDKRAVYDRLGAVGAELGLVSAVADAALGFVAEIRRRRRQKRPGVDLKVTLDLGFSEAALGAARSVRYTVARDCGVCGGSGARNAAGLASCRECHGRGETREGLLGSRVCRSCHGDGEVVVDPCPRCRGKGLEDVEREFHVQVPPGTQDGTVQRVAGEGEPGRRGGPPGDLQVHIRVARHEVLEARGRDIFCELPVSFPTAALGGQVDVPTLDGPVTMRVPAATPSGKVFRLRGRGIPRPDGGRGDHHVRLVIDTPERLSPRARQLLEDLARELGEPAPRPRGIVDRVKELLDV